MPDRPPSRLQDSCPRGRRLLIRLSADGRLGCPTSSAVMCNAAVDVHVQVSRTRGFPPPSDTAWPRPPWVRQWLLAQLPRSGQTVPRAAAPVHVAARSVGSQAPSWELTSHHRAAGSSSSMDQLPGEQWERSRAAMQGLGQRREAGEVRALGTDSPGRAQVSAQAGGAGRRVTAVLAGPKRSRRTISPSARGPQGLLPPFLTSQARPAGDHGELTGAWAGISCYWPSPFPCDVILAEEKTQSVLDREAFPWELWESPWLFSNRRCSSKTFP